MRFWKILAALVILVVAGLAGYAYLGDLTPDRREIRVPIALGPDGLVVGRASAATAGTEGAEDETPTESGDAAAPQDDSQNDTPIIEDQTEPDSDDAGNSAGNDAPD